MVEGSNAQTFAASAFLCVCVCACVCVLEALVFRADFARSYRHPLSLLELELCLKTMKAHGHRLIAFPFILHSSRSEQSDLLKESLNISLNIHLG